MGGWVGGWISFTLVGSSLPLVVKARMATKPAKQRGVMAWVGGWVSGLIR